MSQPCTTFHPGLLFLEHLAEQQVIQQWGRAGLPIGTHHVNVFIDHTRWPADVAYNTHNFTSAWFGCSMSAISAAFASSTPLTTTDSNAPTRR